MVCKGTCSKLGLSSRDITVEPYVILFTLATALRTIIMKSFLYDRVCLANLPANVCEHLNNDTSKEYEEQVDLLQKEASHWL